jgi:hypothetical protein
MFDPAAVEIGINQAVDDELNGACQHREGNDGKQKNLGLNGEALGVPTSESAGG